MTLAPPAALEALEREAPRALRETTPMTPTRPTTPRRARARARAAPREALAMMTLPAHPKEEKGRAAPRETTAAAQDEVVEVTDKQKRSW